MWRLLQRRSYGGLSELVCHLWKGSRVSSSLEGFLDWEGHRTWYRVVGATGAVPTRLPVVICHGGPGGASDSCEPMADLDRGRPLGRSLRPAGLRKERAPALPPTSFWTMEVFKRELDALLRHLNIADQYVVLGQSCGGMLAMEHALEHPGGLKGLVICDSMPSFPLWVEEADKLRSQLPPEVEETLRSHEAAGTTDDPAYAAACRVYYERHLCRVPWPDCLTRGFTQLEQDPTVYLAMNGPSEFYVVGNLKDWDIRDRLHEIDVPTLLVSGRYDEATPRIQEVMMAGIPDVAWALFEKFEPPAAYRGASRLARESGSFLGKARTRVRADHSERGVLACPW